MTIYQFMADHWLLTIVLAIIIAGAISSICEVIIKAFALVVIAIKGK